MNLSRIDPGIIRERAQYLVGCARLYATILKKFKIDLMGQRFLELGPGTDFAHPMLVGEAADEVFVADRFPVAWQKHFHPRFYREVRKSWGAPSRFLDKTIRLGRHDRVVTTIAESAESMPSLHTGGIDVILSNAVLEHVTSPITVVRELARLTRPGGLGLHQVDFRDHADFDKPLEHLLIDEQSFEAINSERHYERGTQLRPCDWARLWTENGFEIETVHVNQHAPEAYMQDFLPRLRSSASAYRDLEPSALMDISAMFVVRRCAA